MLWLVLLTAAKQGTIANWESGFGEHQAAVDTDGRVAEPCTVWYRAEPAEPSQLVFSRDAGAFQKLTWHDPERILAL